MDGCALGLVAARKIQLSLRPGTRLPLSRGVTSGLGAGGGSLARDGWRERHVPAGPVSGEDGRQNSNSRGAGVARGGAAGPPDRADVSGGSGRQRTPMIPSERSGGARLAVQPCGGAGAHLPRRVTPPVESDCQRSSACRRGVGRGVHALYRIRSVTARPGAKFLHR